MPESHYTSLDALLAGYAAGSLPRPLQVLVRSHLELSSSSRSIIAAFEAQAGDLLERMEPVPLSDRDAALEAIFGSHGDAGIAITVPEKAARDGLPRALHDFVGHRLEDIPWRNVMPGFREYVMEDVDGCHVSMFWIKPGRTVPSHTHEGSEISLILKGRFVDERGSFGPGDISVADATIDHRPTAGHDEPCIGFAVTDGALRLTGPLHQRLADILGASRA